MVARAVGGMWRAIRMHHFAENDVGVLAAGIRVQGRGLRMQSELLPSACMVELPSNPQLGIITQGRWLLELLE